MLAPVTDKVQGKGGDQVWLSQPLLHVPVLLLPLPFFTSSLTVHIRLESHLDSIADRGGKGLFLPLTLCIEWKLPSPESPWKRTPFWANFYGQRNAIYQLAIAWVLKLTAGKLPRILYPLNTVGILLQCRFWFRRFGVGSEILHL